MEDYLLVSLPVTFIILGLSVLYSWSNISRLWKAGDPKINQQKTAEPDVSDVTAKSSEITNDNFMTGAGDGWSPYNVPVDADPYEYCGHIQSEVKKVKQRVATREIQQNLTADDMEAERLAQRKQLEEIFKLMQEENEKFGMESMDDVNSQMKLYC